MVARGIQVKVVNKGTKAGIEGLERNPAKLGSGVVGLEES